MTSELISLLDDKLAVLADEAGATEIADMLGYYDRMEHLTGLGFVTCQTFITAVYGICRVEKFRALTIGPQHACGASIAGIVNAAANYWKHNYEWAIEKSPEQRERIETAFEAVGFPVGTEYPLSGVLTELSAPEFASLRAVLRKLEAWGSAVEAAA